MISSSTTSLFLTFLKSSFKIQNLLSNLNGWPFSKNDQYLDSLFKLTALPAWWKKYMLLFLKWRPQELVVTKWLNNHSIPAAGDLCSISSLSHFISCLYLYQIIQELTPKWRFYWYKLFDNIYEKLIRHQSQQLHFYFFQSSVTT